jgi:MarR family 2-MHQ and catechol resistance regulon transcriptional repressor
MPAAPSRVNADIQRFYMALTQLLRNYQFRDRDRQTICGITVTQCYALEFLVHDHRLTILELGRRLVINKSNASRVVDALESIGAVSRSRDPVNHRLRWIEPTPYGHQLHQQIASGLMRDYAAILEPFGAAFVRRVINLLETLATRARQSPCAVDPAPPTDRSEGRRRRPASTARRRRLSR